MTSHKVEYVFLRITETLLLTACFPEEKMRLVLQIQYRASCILQNVNAENAEC